jgi:uncharacterized protein
MPRVVHFEIVADNIERAIKFYKNVFGWEIKKWKGPMEYWMVMTGKDKPGIDGGLIKRNKPVKDDSETSYVCTIDVPSVDDYTKKIIKNGGSIAVPKVAIPGMGWLAYFKDTESNKFGIMQEDKSAK